MHLQDLLKVFGQTSPSFNLHCKQLAAGPPFSRNYNLHYGQNLLVPFVWYLSRQIPSQSTRMESVILSQPLTRLCYLIPGKSRLIKFSHKSKAKEPQNNPSLFPSMRPERTANFKYPVTELSNRSEPPTPLDISCWYKHPLFENIFEQPDRILQYFMAQYLGQPNCNGNYRPPVENGSLWNTESVVLESETGQHMIQYASPTSRPDVNQLQQQSDCLNITIQNQLARWILRQCYQT